MTATLARVLSGFALACLAAGLVQVLFVVTPSHLLSQPSAALVDNVADAVVLALRVATHSAIFASVFALVATGLGEWMSVRRAPYYLACGLVISLLGFFAQYSSEVAGQPTIFNVYAFAAYVSAGLIAGWVYWSSAIRGRSIPSPRFERVTPPAPALPAMRPRLVVEKSPREMGERQKLSERLQVRAPAPTDTSAIDAETSVGELTPEQSLLPAELTPNPAPSAADREAPAAPSTSVPLIRHPGSKT